MKLCKFRLKTEITESDGIFWFSEGHRSFAESLWMRPSKNSEKDTKKKYQVEVKGYTLQKTKLQL